MSGKADPSNWVLSNAPIGSASYLLPTTSSYHLPTTYQADPNRVEVVGHGSGGLPQCLAAAAASEVSL